MILENVKKGLAVSAAALLILLPNIAHSDDTGFVDRESFETITVPSGKFTLTQGSLKILGLDKGWRKVKMAFVQAEAVSRAATIEVWANGNLKKRIAVPASDPNYVVPINEVVESVEVRHVEGGEVRILDVKVVQSIQVTEDLDSVFNSRIYLHQVRHQAYSGVISSLAEAVIRKVEEIEPSLDVELEYVPYMLPIKMSAAGLYAASVGQSDRKEWRHQLRAVLEAINYSRPVIDRMLRTKQLDRKAIDLLALRYAIKEELE